MPQIQCNSYWEIRNSFFLAEQVKYWDQDSWLKCKAPNLHFWVCCPPYWLLLRNCHLEPRRLLFPPSPMKSQNMRKLSPGSVSANFILNCKIQQILDFRKKQNLKMKCISELICAYRFMQVITRETILQFSASIQWYVHTRSVEF